MAGTPTQLVIEHLSGDPALLRDARRRLTLADYPADFGGRIVRTIRRPQPGEYPAIRNARMIRTHARLGALRRVLVQWAAQHAPAEIGGFPALLAWALAAVDWLAVMQHVTTEQEEGVPQRSAVAPGSARSHRRTVGLVFGAAAR
jgi:hypothetical protein